MTCAAAAIALVLAAGCKTKATNAQCDALLDRYAALKTAEQFPDASADVVTKETQRERNEARGDDAFVHCTTEVTEADFACAMKAATSAAIEKCLE